MSEKNSPESPLRKLSPKVVVLAVVISLTVLASSECAENNIAETKAILKERISKDNKDVESLTGLGAISQEEGDNRAAVKYLEKAVNIDPEYPPAHFYLGRSYFTAQEFDDATNEFARFIQLMKNHSFSRTSKEFYINALHDIVQTCFGVKRYDAAREALDEIVSLEPRDQSALYNLGVYYYQYERNRSRAYQYFSKAIEIDPNSPTARSARYAIEYMRANPDSRIEPDFSFIDKE